MSLGKASKILSIARFNLVRLLRERANLFFIFIFPLLVVAILGSQFGGDDTPEIGIVGGDTSNANKFVDGAIQRIEDTEAAEVRRVDDADELTDLVGDGTLPLGVIVPDDAEDTLRAGSPAKLRLVLASSDDAGDDAAVIEGVVTRAFSAEAVIPGVAGQLGGDAGTDVDATVSQLAESLPPIEVERTVAGGGETSEFGFDQLAASMLVLMTFLNTMTAATSLIQSRRLGVSQRMVSTPTTIGTIVLGEGAGRWGIGMFQGLYIMVGTSVLFDVGWGNLLTAVVVLALFAAVAAGAAMLIGALMSNDEQAAGITVMVGLALGALGGAMFPLELFGSTMTTIAHFTPHAWAIDAFTDMARHDATVGDILPELGALAAFAVVLISLAAWRLRLTLTRV